MAKAKLQDYIMLNRKLYKFVVKVAHEVTDDDMNKLEKMFKKYGLTDITKPEKTIFHTKPIDFPNLECAEIWMFDVTFEYPVTPQFLLEDVKSCLKLPESYIVILNSNSPFINAEVSTYTDKDEKSKPLMTSPYKDDIKGTDYYGDEYNKKLCNAVKKHNKEKPIAKVYKGVK